jgi:lipopolysaccharide transport system ATP-binding protein
MVAVEFKHVYKNYPFYGHLSGGLKNFIFNFPKYYKDLCTQKFEALKDINFTIQKGESVAFVGRNGSGKSTTLGLIAGVLKPNQGTVTVNQRVSPLLELGGGFHPELTGIENIKLNGVLLGLSRKQVQEKLNSIIEFSELNEFINQPIRTYSSGMMARLGFSVIAHLEPELLLIDEVLGVGDAAFQKKCFDKIFEFKKQGITVILVSHSANDIEKLCDRCIWIDEYQVTMDGQTATVLEKYFNKYN